MENLKQCKNFGELYEVIGENRFCAFSKLLISVLIASPLVFGVINYVMLLNIDYYNAYDYNYNCMTLCNIIFAIATLWSFMYYVGKIQHFHIGIKELFRVVKESEAWLILWGGLLVWTILPVAFSANPVASILGRTFLGSGYLSHIYMWGIMGCAAMITTSLEREDVMKSFVVIADILAVIMLAFELGIPFLSGFSADVGLSVYTNRNHYGYIIAMSGAIMYGMYIKCVEDNSNLNRRLFYIISFTLNMYVLMINDTLGAFLAIVLSYPVVLILWRASGRKIGVRRFVPLLVIISVTTMSALELIPTSLPTTIGQSLVLLWKDLFKIAYKSEGYEQAGSLRMIIWMNTVEMIKAKPVFGYGPDIMYDKMGEVLMDTPHNEFLECAFFLGIPGLILYVGGLIGAFVKKCKQIKELNATTLVAAGGVISYLISSFVGVRKFNTVCYFFMFMGLIIGAKSLKAKETSLDEVDAKENEATEEES